MTKISDRTIVQQLKQGIRSGCRSLNDTYQGRLVREAVVGYQVAQEDAEELVNDVLLAVMGRIAGFEFKERESDFHRWVMTIFRNRVRDHVRRKAITGGMHSNFDEALFEDESLSSDVEREVLASITRTYQESVDVRDEEHPYKEALHAVGATLEMMQPWEQVLLRCRALRVPYEEIAQYTGKNAKQLKVYHGRVMEKFLTILTREHPRIAEKRNVHRYKR